MNLLLLEPEELDVDAGATVLVKGPRAEHLRTVLRARPGSRVRVGVIDDRRGEATVLAIDETQAKLQIVLSGDVLARPAVDLLLAVPRPKVLKRLWAQLAALGVGRVLLANAAKVERFYFDAHALCPDVYRPLLIEGLAQAQDTRLPLVSVHKRLKVLVEDELDALVPGARRLLADPAYVRSPIEALRAGSRERVLLALGPEGGWTGLERDLLERHGFSGVGLGSRTLRSDTAALAMVALVHEAMRS